MRLATENVLSEFLREIKHIAEVQEKQAELDRLKREERTLRRRRSQQTVETDVGASRSNDDAIDEVSEESATIGAEDDEDDEENEWEGEGSGAWQPGQGVFVDHAAIMDIIIQHLAYPGEYDICGKRGEADFEDELVQSTAMEWVLTFLDFAQTTVVAFMPRIVPAILPNLASPQ